MGTTLDTSSILTRANPDITEHQKQTASGTQHGSRITTQGHSCKSAANGAQQRDAISQICRTTYASRRCSDHNPVTNIGTNGVFGTIGLGAATEHLGQLLPTTAPLLMTTATAPLLHFDQRIATIKRTNNTTNGDRLFTHHESPTLVRCRIEQWPKLRGNRLAGAKYS